MPEKASWTSEDLNNLGNFTAALQEFLQEWQGTVPVKDAMVVISEGEHTIPWGIVSVSNPRDLTVHFETGQFDIGTI